MRQETEASAYRDVYEMTKKQRQLEKQKYESRPLTSNPLVGQTMNLQGKQI